jgi:hypothetical protein
VSAACLAVAVAAATWAPLTLVTRQAATAAVIGDPITLTSSQVWVAPASVVSLHVRAEGGAGGWGGDTGDDSQWGGAGGYGRVVIVRFDVSPGEEIEVVIGRHVDDAFGLVGGAGGEGAVPGGLGGDGADGVAEGGGPGGRRGPGDRVRGAARRAVPRGR